MREIKTNVVRWVDILEPNADDILSIQKEFSLHPLILEEFSTPTLRPKASVYGESLYMAIHIPLFDPETRTTFPCELDIVITGNTLITAHDQEIFQLEDIWKDLKISKGRQERFMNHSPAFLLHYLLETLLESCFPKLDHIAKNLNLIEEEIFAGNEKGMVFEISIVKRDILNFRRTMKPQKTVFESLAQKDFDLISSDIRPYFQDLVGTNIRIWNSLESAKETIESLEDTNNSLLSNKLDMTMKVLTIFSAVLLPLTVYSNILAMSAQIPFGNNPLGFWIHFGIMVFLGLITIALFKVKKWL